MTTQGYDSAIHRTPAEAAAEVSPLAKKPQSRQTERPPSLWAYPATYMLLLVNVLVFVAMFYQPARFLWQTHHYHELFTWPLNPFALLRFSSGTEAIERNQWWRLVTACFVHVTLLHLLINMWCLWNLGLFGEPLLGKPGLVAVYVLTGAAGMLLSLAWNVFLRQPGLTAGASGAVFGIAGILIVLLSNRKLSLPWKELRSLRGSVVSFALVNLTLGLLPRFLPALPASLLASLHLSAESLPQVDNTAHLGGFLTGLALGVPLFPRMTSGRSSYRVRQAMVFGVAALVLVLLAYGLAQFARTPVHR